MKTVRIALLMVFASTLAFAGTTEPASKLNIVEVQEGVYKLSYAPDGSNKVSLKIIDQDGQVILEERIKGNQDFIKKYNLSSQKEGDYTFKIKEDKDVIVKTVTFKLDHQVAIKATKDKKKFSVSVTDAQTKMYVNIYDSADRLLYNEKIEAGKGMFKLYDLSHVRSNVLVELTNDRGVIKRASF